MIRDDIADFVEALVLVYTLMIFAYIIISLVITFRGSVPYNRPFDVVFTFLRQTVEPYLNIFRRFIPPLGPLDLSPIVAIFALQIVGGLLAGVIRG